MAVLILFQILCYCTLACKAANCWNPGGQLQPSNITFQCPTTGSDNESMCCRLLDPSGLTGNDTCVAVGDQPGQWLCLNEGSYWRRGCSDKSWQSNYCVSICASQSNDFHGNLEADWDEEVTPCDDGSYCCGPADVGKPCCDQGQGVWIVNGSTTTTKPAQTSNALDAVATVTLQPTTIIPGSSISVSIDHGLKSRAVGGAIGGAFGAIIVVGIIQFLIFRRIFRGTQAGAGKSRMTVGELHSQETGPATWQAPRNWTAKATRTSNYTPHMVEAPGSLGPREIGSSQIPSQIPSR